MLFYRLSGTITGAKEIEACKDRYDRMDWAGTINFMTSAFNQMHQENVFFFVSDILEKSVSIGIINRSISDIEQYIKPYLEAIELNLIQTVLDEIKIVRLKSMLRNASRDGFIDNDREVLELLAGRPCDVHCLDVVGVEVVSRLGGVAGQFHAESAEVAQLNPVAAEELLAQTVYGVGQDALDGALRERRVVVCNVLAELVERELLVHLSRSVGHRAHGVVISLLGTGLLTCDVDTVVNHKAKVFFLWS